MPLEDAAAAGIDLLLVPALGAQSPATMVDALMRPQIRSVRSTLHRWTADGGLAAAACTSTFLLAEAGLLDGRSATTTWWLRDLFVQRYPKVMLDMDRMVVRDGAIVTAGAAFAHIDLAMSLVARISPRLASETARALLIDQRPTPSVAAFTDHLHDQDRLVSDFEAWARTHLHLQVGVADAALALKVTRRTLERHVRKGWGPLPTPSCAPCARSGQPTFAPPPRCRPRTSPTAWATGTQAASADCTPAGKLFSALLLPNEEGSGY